MKEGKTIFDYMADDPGIQTAYASLVNLASPKLVHSQEPINQKPGLEFYKTREILGKNFLGALQIEKMQDLLCGCGLNVKFEIPSEPFPYTQEDLELATQYNEFLVLRPEFMTVNGEKKLITLNNFIDLFSSDPTHKMNSLFAVPKTNRWFENENFAKEPMGKFGWELVRKKIPENVYLTFSDLQNYIQGHEKLIEDYGGDHCKLRKRSPLEIVYDTILYYLNTGQRLLENEYDYGDTERKDGSKTYIGNFKKDIFSEGLRIVKTQINAPQLRSGVCLSR